MVTLPHSTKGEYLENDSHGLGTGVPYVNRWNIWQGNLDADIILIGQDYGQKEEGSDTCDNIKVLLWLKMARKTNGFRKTESILQVKISH